MSSRMKQWIVVLALIILGLGVYQLIAAIKLTTTTGLLQVTSDDKKSVISVSQANHQAAGIGVGSARAHLKPGTYTVVASTSTAQANQIITIVKHQTLTIDLKPVKKASQNPLDSTTFVGADALVSHGLSSGQLASLKGLLSAYAPKAQTITVNGSSIESGETDPDTGVFKLNFTVQIDSGTYSATVNYAVSNNVQLLLYTQGSTTPLYSAGSAT